MSVHKTWVAFLGLGAILGVGISGTPAYAVGTGGAAGVVGAGSSPGTAGGGLGAGSGVSSGSPGAAGGGISSGSIGNSTTTGQISAPTQAGTQSNSALGSAPAGVMCTGLQCGQQAGTVDTRATGALNNGTSTLPGTGINSAMPSNLNTTPNNGSLNGGR